MPPMRFELLPYDPSASASASVTSGLARFTVLTPSLLRLEYRSAASPSFEDRATLAVVNRRLPVPRFSWDAARGVLETNMVRLVYAGGSFSSHSLHVQPTAAAAARGFHGWRFGETLVESDPSDIFASGYAVTDVWGPDAATLDPDG